MHASTPSRLPLTTADVAALARLTPARIRELDEELRPTRCGAMRVRIYDPEIVAEWLDRRAAAREAAAK
jgi:hypothetical protein